MSTLERLRQYIESDDAERCYINLDAHEAQAIVAVVEAGERLRKYGKAGEGYFLAYDAAIKAWENAWSSVHEPKSLLWQPETD